MHKSVVLALMAFTWLGDEPDVTKTRDAAASEASVQQLVDLLDTKIERRYWSTHVDNNDYEAMLQKIIRHGRAAEKPLVSKLKHDAVLLKEAKNRLDKYRELDLLERPVGFWAERDEVDRLSNNLELLTALRRVQQKPDPLLIQVIPPKEMKAIPGKLPTFSVKLKSVDLEKTPIWMQLIPHFHGTRRESQWRFEVRTNAGDLLPIRPNTNPFRFGGGIKSDGWLRQGDYLDTKLPMRDFIDISEPGEYTVALVYHSKLPIADITDVDELNDLIVFRSQSFPLTVQPGPKLVIESSRSDRAKVRSLVAELPNEELVQFVGGVYDEDDYEFLSPDSPAGKILNLNWRAVPALLDCLSDKTLSRHRKAWIVGLLYTITGEQDLNPAFSGALPTFSGQAGKNTLGADLNEDRSILPREQDELVAKWLTYRNKYLDIRESVEN
jgi:hypothetical protein